MTRPRVVILTGALGAGKTTLLKRILQDEPPGRTGLIVNEFAKGGIDQLVLGEDGFEPETLFGCLCCRDRGDVVQALDRLRGDRRTRRIVIETSGLVTLGVLIGELTGDPRFRNRYELGKVVTVVDAASGPDAILRGAPAGQLRAAAEVVSRGRRSGSWRSSTWRPARCCRATTCRRTWARSRRYASRLTEAAW